MYKAGLSWYDGTTTSTREIIMNDIELAAWAAHYNEKSWRDRLVDAERRGA